MIATKMKKPHKRNREDYESAEKTPDGAIKIAQIGDWELLDAHTGEVSERCVVGTTWYRNSQCIRPIYSKRP